ncbi:MAG: LuxR C-terminal-related transcriptional regulator [Dehalococcoidia bacterium]
MTIRLYLVCDHLLFRNGLTRLLRREQDVHVVGECPLSLDAVDRVAAAASDVVLLSVHAPHMASGPAAQRLYRDLGRTPVVILLMGDDSDDALAALRLGARGVLDKNTDGERLVAALRQAVSGEITVTPRLATRLVADYAAIATGRKPRSGDSELSNREIDVLALLALGDTNQQIADKLCVSVHTVRAHLRSVMQKLGVKNRVQAATYALNSGLGGGQGHVPERRLHSIVQ